MALSNTISFQGRIADNAGEAYPAGSYQFKFAICDVNDNALWTNDGSQVGGSTEPTAGVALNLGVNGTYSLYLGDTNAGMTALTAGLFENTDLHIRVWFDDGNGFQELAPKQPIVPVAYAHYAPNSGNGSSAWAVADTNIYRLNGNVGIGTDNPQYKLDVDGNIETSAGLHISTPGTWGPIMWNAYRDENSI
ncbi:MAG: hypothetical protein GY869_31530, partial [Planctomycetes bacterium]|nr:hypothetical protein [Planctomycetota bacterium]